MLLAAVCTLEAAEKRLFTPCAVSKRVINIGSKPVMTTATMSGV